MIDFTKNLEALSPETLTQIRTIFAALSCVVIVVYWIGIYHLENSTNTTLWSQASTASDPGQKSKKKWIASSTLRKPKFMSTNTIQIPKVALKDKTINTVQGRSDTAQLLIFNTTHSKDLIPGYYYWEDDEWICLAAADANSTNKLTNSVAIQDIPEDVMDKVTVFFQDFDKWEGLLDSTDIMFDKNFIEDNREMAYFEPVKDRKAPR